MKKNDIKKLKRAAMYYEQVIRCLCAASDSIELQPTEYLRYSTGGARSTESLVNEMLRDASEAKRYLEGKIKVFEEKFIK